MEQRSNKLYPSVLLMTSDQNRKQRIENQLNDVNSSNNHLNNIKEMIFYFKDKNHNSKKNIKIF